MSYKFVTLADMKLPPPVVLEQGDAVERSGYRTLDDQVRDMVQAGERLVDWRTALYPGELEDDGHPVPVFMDKLTAADRFSEVVRRFNALQAERHASEAPNEGAEVSEAPDPGASSEAAVGG